ncbi:hypothetical protein SLS58_010175 [Diplodia intermedia]|uniref:Zn(2)-C6 fungal-type domain-containing protein n=1 Tax=Diplodia intermedia TaxID=856260 RepID=A0ABR3T859_9PEZI
MDESLPAASLRGPKISKACEECRRRKQKCNGLSPCNVCSRRNTVCSYRSFIRRRTGRTSTHPAPTAPTPGPHLSQEPLKAEDDPDVSADRESSHADSSAFSEAPPRYHIYKNIRATHVPADSPACVLQLYYGSSSNFSLLQHLHTHLTAHEDVPHPGSHVEEVQNGNESIDVYKYQGLAFGNTPGQRETNPMFLRHELARTFLHNYLSTVHLQLPFLSTDQLCATFERLYGYGDDAKIDPSERALVIVAMAIGACPSQHEFLICSGLGRPSCLSLQDIGLSQPERPSFMWAQVTLSELIRSVQHFYNHHDSSVSADLKHAHRIRNKLRGFAQTVKDDLGFTLGSHLGTERDESFVTRAGISYLYFYTLLLTFRPFLLLFVELKRRGEAEGKDSDSKSNPFNIPPLLEACEHTVDAARSIVMLGEIVFSTGPGAEGVYNNCFFLESACFVLILAALHDRTATRRHIRYINRGIRALRHIHPREPIISIIAAIDEMRGKVEMLTGITTTTTTTTEPQQQPQQQPLSATIPGQQQTPNFPHHGLPDQHQQQQQQQQQQQYINPPDGTSSATPGGPTPGGSGGAAMAPGTDPSQPDLETPPGFGSFEQRAPSVSSDVLDAAWPSMDWNFDLSNLDLESFVSVMGSGQDGATFGLF